MPEIPENYEEARALADKARALAYAIREQHKISLAAHRAYINAMPKRKRPPLEVSFNVAVDRALATDPRYKAAINDNRWYIDYATMYAQGEILEQNREIIALLHSQGR